MNMSTFHCCWQSASDFHHCNSSILLCVWGGGDSDYASPSRVRRVLPGRAGSRII